MLFFVFLFVIVRLVITARFPSSLYQINSPVFIGIAVTSTLVIFTFWVILLVFPSLSGLWGASFVFASWFSCVLGLVQSFVWVIYDFTCLVNQALLDV